MFAEEKDAYKTIYQSRVCVDGRHCCLLPTEGSFGVTATILLPLLHVLYRFPGMVSVPALSKYTCGTCIEVLLYIIYRLFPGIVSVPALSSRRKAEKRVVR